MNKCLEYAAVSRAFSEAGCHFQAKIQFFPPSTSFEFEKLSIHIHSSLTSLLPRIAWIWAIHAPQCLHAPSVPEPMATGQRSDEERHKFLGVVKIWSETSLLRQHTFEEETKLAPLPVSIFSWSQRGGHSIVSHYYHLAAQKALLNLMFHCTALV
jgi:hypothetical protein